MAISLSIMINRGLHDLFHGNLKSMASEMLMDIFAGIPNPPSPAAHLKLSHQSDESILTTDDTTGRVEAQLYWQLWVIEASPVPFGQCPDYFARGQR